MQADMTEQQIQQKIDQKVATALSEFRLQYRYLFDKPTTLSAKIFLRNQPTSSTNLEVGQIYIDSGTVKVKT